MKVRILLSSAVSREAEGIARLPVSAPAPADEFVGAVARLAEASVLAPGRGETAELPVLVHGVHNPVDAGVAADRRVLGVHEDDLVVAVGLILVDLLLFYEGGCQSACVCVG